MNNGSRKSSAAPGRDLCMGRILAPRGGNAE